jgi:hypothetical protein
LTEEDLKLKKLKPGFQVIFMRNDSSQGVEVIEAESIDFDAVQARLEKGESVFIARRT